MTILEQIDENKTFYHEWQNKERKQANKKLIESLEHLIEGRQLLPYLLIEKIIGNIPCDYFGKHGYTWKTKKGTQGLSYFQMLNYVKRYAKTGKHLKNPCKISNIKEYKY